MSEPRIWKLEKDLCRCCHAEGKFTNLSKAVMDQQDIYCDMLSRCFDIDISPVPGDLCNATYTICEDCATKVQNANMFKIQVLRCEEKFYDMLQNNLIEAAAPTSIKCEPIESIEEDPSLLSDNEAGNDSETAFDMKMEDSDGEDTTQEQKNQLNKLRRRSTKVDGILRNMLTATGTAKVKKKAKPKPKKKTKTKKIPPSEEAVKTEKQKEGASTVKPSDIIKIDGTYACAHCEIKYTKIPSLKHHLRTKHYREKTYKCHCGQELLTASAFVKHKYEEHDIDERFECAACPIKFNSRRQLRKHINGYHMLGVKSKCPLCDYETFNRESLYKHKFKHKTIKDLQCRFCKKAFVRKSTLELHERIHTGDRRKVCTVCGQAFVQKASLNYHMTKYHPERFSTKGQGNDAAIFVLGVANNTEDYTIVEDNGQLYQCNACGKGFKQKRFFSQHHRTVHLKLGSKMTGCHFCEQKVKAHLRAKHMEEQHGVPAPTCNACGRKFSYPHQVICHQKTFHMGEKNIVCPICDMKFGSKVNLYQHRVKHLAEKLHKCDVCDERFKWRKQWSRHMVKHRQLSDADEQICSIRREDDGSHTYTCKTCSRTYKRLDSIKQHYRHVHLKLRPKLHGCHYCPEKVGAHMRAQHMEEAHGIPAPSCGACGKKFAFPFLVVRHQKTFHMGERNYVCPVCDMSFGTKPNLRQHVIKHTTERPFKYWREDKFQIVDEGGLPAYQCVDCGRTFKKRDHFSQHYKFVHLKMRPKLRSCHLCNIKVPTQYRPFHMEQAHGLPAPTCGACGKKFAFPNQVLRHQKIYHMGEKQFTCGVCDMKFASKRMLSNHSIIHTALRPYKCNYCDKSFRWKKNLKTHIYMHLDVRKHVCQICEESFVQQTSLKYHMTKKHAETL
ncbi:unnamed protein product [Leptosia nina]|uniref:Uncharacterized protein n=1 Tax=Leptosia nina TaxID=320188 RepID=A0AAV1K1A1_9NEOP